METDGWIKLHRKLLDNPITGRPNYYSLWVTLLLLASHSESRFVWNGKVETLKSGQLVTGRKKLSIQTGISETTIERILDFLEKDGQIGQQKNTKYRLITIVKWGEYQNTDNKRTTNGQQTDTFKNVKNIKNVRIQEEDKEREADASQPQSKETWLQGIPEEDLKEIIEKYKVTRENVLSKADDLYHYCQSKGKKYRNYKSFLINAVKRDFKPKYTDTKTASKYENIGTKINN